MSIRVVFISLGCDKNLVDSEKMLAGLKNEGYEITDDAGSADVAVVNTCCFIHDAKQESINTILELSEYKNEGSLKFIIITGCLATRYAADINTFMPEVDAIIGSSASDEISDTILRLFEGRLKEKIILKDINREPQLYRYRGHNTLKNYSYIKIADGCNKRCTYCVIPSIKGAYRSAAFEDVISEAEDAVKKGKNELILVAQETTLYGTDLYGKKRISELLYALNDIKGLDWIRLMYCYPEEIDDKLIAALKNCEKAVKYIDMPIQHISDGILKRMGRRTDGRDIKDKIELLRKEIPDIAIRTSLITGFPGETDEEHQELLDFIEGYRLDRVGVFTYSKEENTPAAGFKPQILKKIKEKRRRELMLAQQKVVFTKNKTLVGGVQRVVIEGQLAEEGVYVGRTYRDAPDVDGCCFVETKNEPVLGTMVEAKIMRASGYDLIAEEVYK